LIFSGAVCVPDSSVFIITELACLCLYRFDDVRA
jgi:hypothetical protein